MAKINVPSDVREAAAALGEPKPMRRGSLTAKKRYMKCGQKSCRSRTGTSLEAGHAQARHGSL